LKIFFIIIFAFVFFLNAFAQTREEKLDGFLGIKGGTSQEEVSKAMLGKEDISADKNQKNPSKLFFTGGKWESFKPFSWIFTFSSEGLHTVEIILSPEDNVDKKKQAEELYSKAVHSLKRVYGEPKELESSEKQKDNQSASWEFPSDGDTNSVSISVTPNSTVNVVYQNGAMVHRLLARKAIELKYLKLHNGEY
jgi:hypothetical protein